MVAGLASPFRAPAKLTDSLLFDKPLAVQQGRHANVLAPQCSQR